MTSKYSGHSSYGGRELLYKVIILKKISWLLRYRAEQKGLKLREGGYINIMDTVSIKLKNGLLL